MCKIFLFFQLNVNKGGRFDWIKIAHALADVAPPEAIIEELMGLAKKLKGLPERLAERGVSTRLLQLPAIGFDFLDEKLKAWELLN
tara:strand:+ start:324 stop:581 length:258 start_codon:yes stop_codon:yes gene_type:complete